MGSVNLAVVGARRQGKATVPAITAWLMANGGVGGTTTLPAQAAAWQVQGIAPDNDGARRVEVGSARLGPPDSVLRSSSRQRTVWGARCLDVAVA